MSQIKTASILMVAMALSCGHEKSSERTSSALTTDSQSGNADELDLTFGDIGGRSKFATKSIAFAPAAAWTPVLGSAIVKTVSVNKTNSATFTSSALVAKSISTLGWFFWANYIPSPNNTKCAKYEIKYGNMPLFHGYLNQQADTISGWGQLTKAAGGTAKLQVPLTSGSSFTVKLLTGSCTEPTGTLMQASAFRVAD